MGNMRARMFNRRASGRRSRAQKVIDTLGIVRGQRVADIGAGGGYFSYRFAGKVGKSGGVFSVDINEDFLSFIGSESRERGLENIVTVRADDVFETLKDGSLDLVFLRNVFHHIPDRISYFRKMRGKLGEGGRMAIIDYKIIGEMERAGFRLQREYSFLPEQSFLLFSADRDGVEKNGSRVNKKEDRK